MLRLLSNREHAAELERKLLPHASDAASLAQVLDALQTKGFINEARWWNCWCTGAPLVGCRPHQAGTAGQGADGSAVAAATERLRATEPGAPRAVWRKKFAQPPQDATERARQMRFLASRGLRG